MTDTNGQEQPQSPLMAALAHEAATMRPRMFAVYGVLREIEGIAEAEPYVGWGMEFGDSGGAVYWHPDDRSTHYSDSAEQVLRFHRRIGTANLRWLDVGEAT
jgi:hypothetical protein